MKFNNRDLTWLHFNYRVLQEAMDDSLPLYDRLKFLAIYSNNLDEFYRVRVSYYRQLMRQLDADHPKIKEVAPRKVLAEINKHVTRFQREFVNLFHTTIIPELRRNQICILDKNVVLTPEQETYVSKVFYSDILPYVQPVTLVKNRIRPFLRNGQVYVVIKMFPRDSDSSSATKRPVYGLLKLPTDHNIERFVEIPKDAKGNFCIMFLEEIMMRYYSEVFPGYDCDEWYSIKITRDADLEYEDHENEELIEIIKTISVTRQLGLPNRFQYDYNMPQQILQHIAKSFNLKQEDFVAAGMYLNFRDFFLFPNPKFPELESPRHKPLRVPVLDKQRSLLKYFKTNEVLLHYPYHSFQYFLRFLQEAAIDTHVTEIKTTLYRVAGNSAVVKALILAAQNGKKVTVFVELKARFDEENNLLIAKEMLREGIHIIYSIPGVKVHAKMAMVIRVKNSQTIRTTYLATGNLNEKTAELYADHGFFTSDIEINADVEQLFLWLETKVNDFHLNHLLVPNINMVEAFSDYIEFEIQEALKGNPAHIILKMNGIDDKKMINKLYKASKAGVKIDLLVRGACCIRTDQEFSANMRVIRIVDKFLEHARAFYFYRGGEEKVLLGSADWMRRNLYKRIECVFPIYNPVLKQEVIDILQIQLSDNVKAAEIDSHGHNRRIVNNLPKVRAQLAIYDYVSRKNSAENAGKVSTKKA